MRLGRLQHSVLYLLAERGPFYRGCGWSWSSYAGTGRILDSLLRHQLAEAHDQPVTAPQPGPRHARPQIRRVYTLTRAGKAYLVGELEADLDRLDPDDTMAIRISRRLAMIENAEVTA
jgi:hypothetical protein